MLLSKFLDDLLKFTKEQSIKWITVDSSNGAFMTTGNSGNLRVDQLIEYNGRQFEVTMHTLDNICLSISTDIIKEVDGKEPETKRIQIVLPQHQQSKLKEFVINLYDCIIELQIDTNLFGALENKQKSKQVNS